MFTCCPLFLYCWIQIPIATSSSLNSWDSSKINPELHQCLTNNTMICCWFISYLKSQFLVASDYKLSDVMWDYVSWTMSPWWVHVERPFLYFSWVRKAIETNKISMRDKWSRQYLPTDKPFAILISVGGRLERNKAIKKAIGIALLQARDHFIDPNKSIVIRFHDVLCRNNFCLQNSNRQKEGYVKFLIGFA